MATASVGLWDRLDLGNPSEPGYQLPKFLGLPAGSPYYRVLSHGPYLHINPLDNHLGAHFGTPGQGQCPDKSKWIISPSEVELLVNMIRSDERTIWKVAADRLEAHYVHTSYIGCQKVGSGPELYLRGLVLVLARDCYTGVITGVVTCYPCQQEGKFEVFT